MEPFLAFIDAVVAFVEALAAIADVVLGILDLACLIADVYAWIRGRQNRIERREAKRAGEEVVPDRDLWNRRVIILTALVCAITVIWLLVRR